MFCVNATGIKNTTVAVWLPVRGGYFEQLIADEDGRVGENAPSYRKWKHA
jgi:hypothetical protein